jgi:hypothetical protein
MEKLSLIDNIKSYKLVKYLYVSRILNSLLIVKFPSVLEDWEIYKKHISLLWSNIKFLNLSNLLIYFWTFCSSKWSWGNITPYKVLYNNSPSCTSSKCSTFTWLLACLFKIVLLSHLKNSSLTNLSILTSEDTNLLIIVYTNSVVFNNQSKGNVSPFNPAYANTVGPVHWNPIGIYIFSID